MRLVVLSDTHSVLHKMTIPDGDILIHCGDFCKVGTIDETKEFAEIIGRCKHQYKIVIAGNHDVPFGSDGFPGRSLLPEDVIYLEDSLFVIEGFRFYGTPGQFLPRRLENRPRPGILARMTGILNTESDSMKAVWNWIPTDLDVLITHGPPLGILDQDSECRRIGSKDLRQRLDQLRLKLHCFGHVHESYGYIEKSNVLYLNASSVDRNYEPVNPPFLVELEESRAKLLST